MSRTAPTLQDDGPEDGHRAEHAAAQGARKLAKGGRKTTKRGLEAAGIEGVTEAYWLARLGIKLVKWLALPAAMLIATFIVIVAGIAGSASAGSSDGMACSASPEGEKEIPAAFGGVDLMAAFQSAANARDNPTQRPLGDRGKWILAAIASIESSFGKNMGPSEAGAVGFMQFMPATWRQVGVDTDGDRQPDRAYGDVDGDGTLDDPKDPAVAIPAAASYLRAAGAPKDWYEAIFAYNHADWYVQDVQELADAYQGICTLNTVAFGAAPGGMTRLSASGTWLDMVPGTSVRCDRRIVANVMYLVTNFNLKVGSCYAPTGHEDDGEHPLGLAIDALPKDGNWGTVMAAARFVGWDESCALKGCPNKLARWIGYNGVANHGDPSHCRAPCPAHLHISWNHARTPYNTQAPWVDVWQIQGSAST